MTQKQPILNKKKWKERDEIVKCGPYSGGVASFKNLCIYKLRTLVEMGVVDINVTQNNSPSVEEFMEFMEKYPFIKSHGYVIKKNKADYCLAIEGLEYKSPYKPIQYKVQLDFSKLCRTADNFLVEDNKLYSWWD